MTVLTVAAQNFDNFVGFRCRHNYHVKSPKTVNTFSGIREFFLKYLEKCSKYHKKYLRFEQRESVINTSRVHTVLFQYWHALIHAANHLGGSRLLYVDTTGLT